MAVPKSVITDAELQILNILWADEAATAREIADRMYGAATTSSIGTVQKLIARLEEKSLVRRDRGVPAHRFSTAVSQADVAGMQLEEFASKLSAGSLSRWRSLAPRAPAR